MNVIGRKNNKLDTLFTMPEHRTPSAVQNKCPESALPLLQPWLQLWLQRSVLFSQNAPVCHSFCPLLGRYTHQCPKQRAKKKRITWTWCISLALCNCWTAVSCVAWLHHFILWLLIFRKLIYPFPATQTEGGGKKVERKRRMEEDCDMSLPLSSGHIFKSLSGKVNWHKGTFVPETVAKLQFY